ncbi:MAG: phage protein NinX family protein, partial [Leclercia sp.]
SRGAGVMDYSKMSDFEINCDVANAIGLARHLFFPSNEDEFDGECPLNERGPIWQTRELRIKGYKPSNGNCFNPCNNPADAWPIIEANNIAVIPYRHTPPQAWPTAFGVTSRFTTEDEKPLRAAMIVFLMMQGSANVPANSTGSDIR